MGSFGSPFVYSWGKVKAKEKQMSMIHAVEKAQERLIERFDAGNPQEAHIQFERPRGGNLSPEKFTLCLTSRKYGNCICDDMGRYLSTAEVMRNGKGVVAMTYFFGTRVTKTLYFEDLMCVKVTYMDEWVPENLKKEETEVETENTPF
jgi:hypothetical protein